MWVEGSLVRDRPALGSQRAHQKVCGGGEGERKRILILSIYQSTIYHLSTYLATIQLSIICLPICLTINHLSSVYLFTYLAGNVVPSLDLLA